MKYGSILLAGGVIYLVADKHFIWAAFVFLLITLIFTTNYVTELNLEQKKYLDYLSVLGIKINVETTTFNRIDRIIIVKQSYSQVMNSRIQTTKRYWTDYTGKIVFDNHKMMDLVTRTNKDELVIGLKDFAKFLGVSIEDRSGKESYWIN
jgi:hypothetical protein